MPSRTIIIAVAAVGYTLLVFHWGDKYGPNAQMMATIAAELRAKNSDLTRQLEEDAATYASEQADLAERETAFDESVAAMTTKCPLDAEQVDALNKLIGD